MGAGLVKRAYAYAADVPLYPNEFRLLAFMALTALDADVPPRYFDSREASALALGRRVPDKSAPGEKEAPERVAAFEAVKVATRGLVSLGALEQLRFGHRGQRAEFALRMDLSATRCTDEFRRRRNVQPSPSRKAGSSPFGKPDLPLSKGSPFPQGRTEDPEGHTGGTTHIPVTTSLAAVDNSEVMS